MQRIIRRNLYATTFLTDFTIGLLVFAVSRHLAETGAGLATLGIVGGLFSFGWAVSSVLCGQLSDYFGRKRLICTGIVCLFTGSIGSALTQSYLFVHLGFYFLGGISAGMIYPAVIAWLNREQNSAGTRAQATGTLIRFCLAWNLGLISGQFSAGVIFALRSTFPFYIAALLCLVNMFFMINTDGSTALQFITKPDNPKQAASAIFAKISWTANLSGAFAVGLVLHLFPDLAVKLGVPSNLHGTMLAIMRIVVIATYLTMHSLTFWHHRFAVNVVSQFAGLCGLLFLAFAVSPIWLIVGLCFLGFLMGFNYFASLYYSTSSSHEKKKGLAGGIHEATLALGISCGSMIGGIAGSLLGVRAPYWLSVIILVVFFCAQVYQYIRSR